MSNFCHLSGFVICIMHVHFLKQFIYSKINHWHWEIFPPVQNIPGDGKCCGTTLSIVHIPASAVSLVPCQAGAWQIFIVLELCLRQNPSGNKLSNAISEVPIRRETWNYVRLFRSHIPKNTSCGKLNCCTPERVLRLTYLTSFFPGKCGIGFFCCSTEVLQK